MRHGKYDPTKDIQPGQEETQTTGKSLNPVKLIANLAHEEAVLYHTPDREVYATLTQKESLENLKIRSTDFKNMLRFLYFKKTGQAACEALINKVVANLEATGRFNGPEIPVHVRCAGYGNSIYIDLCNSRGEQVHISSDGWQVIPAKNSPIKFIRPQGMRPLPVPDTNGSIGPLGDFLNVESDSDLIIIVSFLLSALKPSGPFPILFLQGGQGSSKSTTARLLRSLVDPSTVPTQAMSKTERDLIIACGKSWVLNFDNLSRITPKKSDALCRLSTGGGFRIRKNYTDNEEQLFSFCRPIIINCIGQVTDRHDLFDRALIVNLPSISDTGRKTEKEIWNEFEKIRPIVLGGLYSAIAEGLKNLDSVKIDKLPRMADFAKWIIAAEPALPWKQGAFLEIFNDNRGQMVETAIESDVVAFTVFHMMRNLHPDSWSGTPTELKKVLDDILKASGWKGENWPKAPNALSNRLFRAQGFLKKKNIMIGRSKSGDRRIKITWITQPAASTKEEEEEENTIEYEEGEI